MFHQNIVEGLCGTLVNNSITLIQKLQEHKNETPLNMYMIMHLVSLDNICGKFSFLLDKVLTGR